MDSHDCWLAIHIFSQHLRQPAYGVFPESWGLQPQIMKKSVMYDHELVLKPTGWATG